MQPAFGENAVIVDDNGSFVRFHTRCPNCGHVNNITTNATSCGNGIINNAGYFTCPKCSKGFNVRIMRH